MVNIWLVIVMAVISVMVLIASVYILVYFQSEDDKNTAWAPKIAVVFGLTLVCLLVLMLPLDVANRSAAGGLPMDVLWQTLYITVAVMCIGIVPFLMFYYEAWDPESKDWQMWTAIKYELCTVFIVSLTMGLMWIFLGYANVPIDELSYNYTAPMLKATDPITCPRTTFPGCASVSRPTTMKIDVTIPVYIIAMVAFIGWFLFTIFAGVGLVALPMDLIAEYTQRPQPIDLEEYAKQRMLLNERSKQLMELAAKLGTDAHRKKGSRDRKKFNQFRQSVYCLERDWNKVKKAYKERGGNPLLWMCQALLGCFAALLSVMWYLHLILYNFISPPPTIFLNGLFIELDKAFALFGVVSYGLFSFYLLACVLKGCLKVGLRFLWIPIHPMKIGATMMNSFLFNVWLLLLCGVATVQFCFTAFQSYAQLTAVDMLLGVQVRNLEGLSVFFQNHVFFYCMLGVSALTLLYLCAFPHDKSAIEEDDEFAWH